MSNTHVQQMKRRQWDALRDEEEAFLQMLSEQRTAQSNAAPDVSSAGEGGGTPEPDVPPVEGYSIWIAPESDIYSDADGSIPAVVDGQVRHWEDLSENNNNMIFTSSMNASGGPFYTGSLLLNGKRAIPFGHSTNAAQPGRTGLLSTNAVPLTNGCTVFFVGAYMAPVAATENGGVWFGYRNFELLVRDGQGVPGGTLNRLDTYNNSGGLQLHDPVTMVNGEPHVFAWRFDAVINEQRIYRDGVSAVSGTDNGAVPATGRISMGFRADDGINSHLSGYYAEMIVYNHPLTDAEVTLVNDFLLDKYGL